METPTEELITGPAPLVAHCVKCEQGPKPRGSWSKFHCESCDIERKNEIDEAHARVIGDPDVAAKGWDWFVTESANLRRERGWT